ncbi:histidine kinase [Streptomyces thermoviolaceus]
MPATAPRPPALPPGWERAARQPHGPGTATAGDILREPPAHAAATGTGTDTAVDTDTEQSLALQVRAVQAMCRHVFAFRLAMIALAAPSALVHAAPGLAVRLVGAAVVVTFMGSYVLFRDWERFGPLLLRHPTLLAADTVLGALPLIAAGPDSTLAYVSVCTPLLAGILYGWRGAAVLASLQSLILLLVQAAEQNLHAHLAQAALVPGLCLIAGAAGASQRTLLLRFGAATRALTTAHARLAAVEAVSEERARLARDMHDSVAKTLQGVALAADALAATAGAEHPDTARLRQQADLVARSARRAATEARELLTDLRQEPHGGPSPTTDLVASLIAETHAFTARTGLPAVCHPAGAPVPPLPAATARHLLAVATEAMENAHRHADATRIDVRADVYEGLLCVSVHDDGKGLPPDTTLERLRAAGRFGLVGMVERAAAVGARIRIGRGTHPNGTEVRLELPLASLPAPPASGPDP